MTGFGPDTDFSIPAKRTGKDAFLTELWHNRRDPLLGN
jgi:hypothetical protein